MRCPAVTALTLAGTVLAGPTQVAERQAGSPESFTTAASALISAYIPPSAYSVLSASASAAAARASLTGDVDSLIYSALEASSLPRWFASAIPAEYTAQVASLTAAIGSLAPTPTATLPDGIGTVSVDSSLTLSPSQSGNLSLPPTPTVSQTVVVTTVTDPTGGVSTTSFTSAVVVTGGTTTTTSSGTTSTTSSSSSGSGTAASTTSSSSSTGTNVAATAGPTGVMAGVVGLMGLMAAL